VPWAFIEHGPYATIGRFTVLSNDKLLRSISFRNAQFTNCTFGWFRHLEETYRVVGSKGKMTWWRMVIQERSPECCTCSAKHSRPLTQAHMEDSLFLAVLPRIASRLW
jgi:hypothetical protein